MTPRRVLLLVAAMQLSVPQHVWAQEHPGEAHYRRVCFECHDKGRSTTQAGRGAPRLGDARAWESRVAKGLGPLTQKVLTSTHGKVEPGIEPHEKLKKFRQDLTDEQVSQVIKFMFDQIE